MEHDEEKIIGIAKILDETDIAIFESIFIHSVKKYAELMAAPLEARIAELEAENKQLRLNDDKGFGEK